MRIILIAVSLLFVGSFCPSGLADAGQPSLRVGMDIPYPPFAMYDDSGKLVGFDVEITEAICREIKRDCTILPLPFETLIDSIVAGNIDLGVAGMMATEERKRFVDFSDKYFRSLSVFIQVGQTVYDLRPGDVPGRRIVVQSGTVQGGYLEKMYGDTVTIVAAPAFEEIFLFLKEGKADFALMDGLSAFTYLKTPDGLAFETVGEPISMGGAGDSGSIAVSKKLPTLRDDINKAIQAIRRNGEYAKINRKYFDFTVY